MDKICLRKLTAAMMVSAGLLAVDLGPLYAQSQSQQGNTGNTQSQSSQGTRQNKNQSSAHAGHHGTNAKMGSSSAGSMFVKKAAESNMAEIELSRLALQNASSQQVKEYAQQMIDHHTMAQQELASIVSGSAAMHASQSGNDANMDDSQTKSDNNSGAANVSGGTTGSGSTYSSGNASGAEGTQGNVTGQGSNATAGKQGNSSGSNDPNAANNTGGTTGGSKAGLGAGSDYKSSSTGGGGAGANAGGTTSSTGLGTAGTTDAIQASNAANSNTEMNNSSATSSSDSGSGTAGSSASSAGNTASSAKANGWGSQPSDMYDDLPPIQLSPEHQALHTKLSKLNGAEFDSQYIQAMVKDHAKAVELFDKQSKSSSDAALQGYASKNLPLIKQHYQMAQKLSASKNSSAKGTSDSK